MLKSSSNAKAIVLVSGGPDSATSLFIAKNRGYDCYALTINYGQHAQSEIKAAKKIGKLAEVIEHRFIQIDLAQFKGSALTSHDVSMPGYTKDLIPKTYVPARNTIFLSLALSYAESIEAQDIFIGAHIVDYNNYPDCRPEYFQAFTQMAILGTKQGQELGKEAFHIQSPLIQLNKAEIFRLGSTLGIDFKDTISCYQPNDLGHACKVCSSCELRLKGFQEANMVDPTVYIT